MGTVNPKVEYIEVPFGDEERRLDNFLLSQIKGVPKSHIYAIIRSGEVRINSKRAKPSSRIKNGDKIRIPPIRKSNRVRGEPGQNLIQLVSSSIIHQDENLIVLNKPRGCGSHGGINIPFGIIEVLQYIYKSNKVYLAHRLDLETTGVLIIARNIEVLRELNAVWREANKCRKIYMIIVQGIWQKKEQKVTSKLAKREIGGRFLMTSYGNNEDQGKEATTNYKLLKHKNDCSLLEAQLITGRTHQIRAQCAEAGYPIVGDDKYSFIAKKEPPSKKTKQDLALHCHKIEVQLQNKSYKFEAPLPYIFTQMIG